MAPAARQSGLPRYLEIAARLRRDLASGRWQPGERLPSIAEFAEEFGVTPVTAREAVKVVEAQGMVEMRRGSGTYVSAAALQLHSLALRSDLRSIATQLTDAVPERLPAPDGQVQPPVPAELRSARSYRRLYRLARRAGQPFMVADVWLDARQYRRAPARFDSRVALAVLMELDGGARLRRHRQYLTVDVAGPALAALLGRPAYSPVAEVHVVLADRDQVAVYLGTLIFPADLVRVEFDNDTSLQSPKRHAH